MREQQNIVIVVANICVCIYYYIQIWHFNGNVWEFILFWFSAFTISLFLSPSVSICMWLMCRSKCFSLYRYFLWVAYAYVIMLTSKGMHIERIVKAIRSLDGSEADCVQNLGNHIDSFSVMYHRLRVESILFGITYLLFHSFIVVMLIRWLSSSPSSHHFLWTHANGAIGDDVKLLCQPTTTTQLYLPSRHLLQCSTP